MPYKGCGKDYAIFSLKPSVQYESYNLGGGLQTALCVFLKRIKSMEMFNTYLEICLLRSSHTSMCYIYISTQRGKISAFLEGKR